ncbi:prephenate dehydratase [Cellulomonas fimi]|uniref:Prephenate dehydratase n=1 Tax=Cellulomonas fimi (strain ATCC 484 / DSM 20113 / JCM 1341 / CCUG 24087 / LMG 16345 / NBRC 15513 / NCIMB 8980 / NCTC 7547 / NRS-133) TaxID=590998 RepID=F4H3P8_CELFA|nr:prephenate dehydratase [Cellulomonas fimi]AEE47714.1 prephenate dehydratase [Cellulomonas fimi ATCC 484]NNH09086.1 prephenate dehydratase [Cellulomonas fimi]VEH36855.1 Prephenate dehydratase [Cellulomonas fimi]
MSESGAVTPGPATPAGADRPRYAYLGPAGTFTEAALRQVVSPQDAQYLPQTDVAAAIGAVRSGEADYAVVAIESTVEGGVTATLDSLAGGSPLVLLREVLVPVQFTLAAAPGVTLAEVRRISAHPHAWVQCRRWLAHHLPRVVHVPATSNTAPAALLAGRAAQAAADLGFDAALVPPTAVDTYGLVPLAVDVADNATAVTRFVVVGHPGEVPPPTGADKTTLVVHLPDNEAGALLAMLEQFAVRGVNLSRIESRPIGDALGRYSFSIDAEGHITDERVGEAIMGLHRRCPHVRFLGSYPRADAVAPTVHVGTADADFVTAREWLRAVRGGRAT